MDVTARVQPQAIFDETGENSRHAWFDRIMSFKDFGSLGAMVQYYILLFVFKETSHNDLIRLIKVNKYFRNLLAQNINQILSRDEFVNSDQAPEMYHNLTVVMDALARTEADPDKQFLRLLNSSRILTITKYNILPDDFASYINLEEDAKDPNVLNKFRLIYKDLICSLIRYYDTLDAAAASTEA